MCRERLQLPARHALGPGVPRPVRHAAITHKMAMFSKSAAREGHVMIRTCGVRGLVVTVLAACAALAVAPAAQADPAGDMSVTTAEAGRGTRVVDVSPPSRGQASVLASRTDQHPRSH